MKKKSRILLILFASTLPAFAHGPLRGALNDTVSIGQGFETAGKAVIANVVPPIAAAGKHIGQNVYRGGKGLFHFGKWLVS